MSVQRQINQAPITHAKAFVFDENEDIKAIVYENSVFKDTPTKEVRPADLLKVITAEELDALKLITTKIMNSFNLDNPDCLETIAEEAVRVAEEARIAEVERLAEEKKIADEIAEAERLEKIRIAEENQIAIDEHNAQALADLEKM